MIIALITGKLFLFHYILSKGCAYIGLYGIEKREEADLFTMHMGRLNRAYKKGRGFLKLMSTILSFDFPKYQHNTTLFPLKEEPP
jgi:hypothetical protein